MTLGIIGVVAALTMPTLISNYKKQEIAARVKTFYSVISQAIQMSEIDNGPSREWIKEQQIVGDEPANNRNKALTYFNRYLKAYIKYLKIDENPVEIQDEEGQADMIKVYLPNGTYFYFNNGTCAHFLFDSNGERKPNSDGRDVFHFLLCPTNITAYINENGSNLVPWLTLARRETREAALQACKLNAHSCSAILMQDGWEFKSDYPHKL